MNIPKFCLLIFISELKIKESVGREEDDPPSNKVKVRLSEAVIVILPAPLVISISVPPVSVARTGSLPVEPIGICPFDAAPIAVKAVSYTHLTLPTSDLV